MVISKKTSLSESGSGRPEKVIFQIVNFRSKKSCVVSNCSVQREKTFSEIEIVIALKTTELTHGNRMHPKKVSIIIFLRQSLWRDKLCAAVL